MNNKVVLTIVGILVVAGIIYFATQKKDDSTSETKNDTATADTKTEASDGTFSLKKLIDSGKHETCTFSSEEGTTKTQGTVYVASPKMRGDFSGTFNGQTSTTHMIYDGATAYSWIDGQSTGFKMKLDGDVQSNQQMMDPNKDFNFSCKSGSGDSNKFDLPKGVTFSDLGTVTLPSNINANSNTNIQAAVCDQLPEPSKTQCKAALEKK